MSLQKSPRIKSKKYREYVKSLPSCISGMPSDDAHHIKGHFYTGASTPSDIFVIPLTRSEHTNFHNIGYKRWEAEYGSQIMYALRTIEQAITDGVIKI